MTSQLYEKTTRETKNKTYMRECREDRGGCGKRYRTTSKRARVCPECQIRKKEEREGVQEAKDFDNNKLITCGVCKRKYLAKYMRTHIEKMHYEAYKQLMVDYYALMENLKGEKQNV